MIWPGEETEGQELCQNGIDDDGDGLIDCSDPDCTGDPGCREQELCQNGIDDDGDGLIDCQDPDCASHLSCRNQELCQNGLDDDGDGLIDCEDPECFADPRCGAIPEDCQNGRDDDGDGFIDCQDPDCRLDPRCSQEPEQCQNRLDDDGDGLTDCNDPDCFADPACLAQPEDCQNGRDDDGDGLVDCDDPQCFADPRCRVPEQCQNGLDDDGDGLTDCDDPDCASHPSCRVAKEQCQNGLDDDGDGLVDCDDPDCFKHPDCKTPGIEICNNGLDDDEDSKIDCADPDCMGLPICQPGQEICDNLLDDDGDGAVDCDDPDCQSLPSCLVHLCQSTVDFGTLQPKGSSATRTLSSTGTTDSYQTTCSVPGGGEVVARFQLVAPTDLKLAYEQLSGDQVFGLFRAGVNEPCNANPVSCFDPESARSGSFSIKSLPAGLYYLIAEAFAPGLEGQAQVTLSTAAQGTSEICNNGIDDDLDGAVDCADLDCALDQACASQLCQVDKNLGALVIDGPPKSTTVDTANAANLNEESCAAGGGGDRVIRFVMPSSGVLAVTVFQSGWHVLGLHSNLGPGTRCTADPGSCFDTNQELGFTLVYDSVEKGVYYYVVDALGPGDEGTVELSFQAYANRGPELCANNVDDDGDGMIDCNDPDCAGVVGCSGPVCAPDFNIGALVPNGPGASLTVDVTTANNDQTVACALGGGKDAVIALELTEVSGLEFSCAQSGDHVFGLFSSGQPRDPCDADPVNCADPTLGPLDCNFIMPNLQPGKYYLIVEAFRPGDEGWVDLSLRAVPDHAQEICNNGIDDDGDGKVDCLDSNCATTPLCQGLSCTPDQKLGLLSTTGVVKSAAVTTLGAGDSVNTGCASGGGEDVVLGFTLAAAATVTIDFAQFGNHVIALFDNRGIGFACDAAPLGCQPSGGQSIGAVSFSNVPAGEYYLIVEAAAAGSEGSMVLQLAAQ